MGWSAFAPKGNSIAIAGATTASAGVQAPGFPGEQENNCYLVSNSTSQACFLSVDSRAGVLAVIPTGTGANAANGLYIGGNTTQSFTFDNASYFSVITPTATTTLYITPGDGL